MYRLIGKGITWLRLTDLNRLDMLLIAITLLVLFLGITRFTLDGQVSILRLHTQMQQTGQQALLMVESAINDALRNKGDIRTNHDNPCSGHQVPVTETEPFSTSTRNDEQNCLPQLAPGTQDIIWGGTDKATRPASVVSATYIAHIKGDHNSCADETIPALVSTTIPRRPDTNQWIDVLHDIEAIQVRFGLDWDHNGLVDQYLDPKQLSQKNAWSRVKLARIWILVRSHCALAADDYTNKNHYPMGNTPLFSPNDHYPRLLISKTIRITG